MGVGLGEKVEAGVHLGCVHPGYVDDGPDATSAAICSSSRAKIKEVSVMVSPQCFSILLFADDFAGTESDLPGVFDAPGLGGGGDFASSPSVAMRSSPRLRARSCARARLRQAMRAFTETVGVGDLGHVRLVE